MAKNEEITLIIAKAFSKQPLTEKEKDICCDLTTSKLVSEHGLNDIQSEAVIKWCALQQINIAYSTKEDLINEGLFDNFFKKKNSNKYNKIIKSYVANAKRDEDEEHMSLYLHNIAKITTHIQKRGLATFEKKSSKRSDRGQANLLDRALDEPGANDKLSAISEDLKRLDDIVKFVKALHDSIKGKTTISSAKRKIKENSDTPSKARVNVNKPRRKISHALLVMSNYTKRDVFRGNRNIKRAADSFIDVIAKKNNIKNQKQKKELSLAVKEYLGNVYKELESIHNAEKKSTVNRSL